MFTKADKLLVVYAVCYFWKGSKPEQNIQFWELSETKATTQNSESYFFYDPKKCAVNHKFSPTRSNAYNLIYVFWEAKKC